MNVAFDPWIPVVNTSGNPELASLCSALSEGEKYVDLAVRPHERVALMRLLICVAHAALDGPKDYEDWCDVPKRLPEAVKVYLEEKQDCFLLFDNEKPWLQVTKLTGDKPSPVALLDFELATGNNATLYDHEGQLTKRPIPKARIALSLLTFLCFSPGGGSPIAQWENVKTSQVGNPDAPCISQSMAHALIRGELLTDTIHRNLPTFEAISRSYKSSMLVAKDDKANNLWKRIEFSDIALGRPVWEMFPEKPDPRAPESINATRTYLGRLVPISRWIRLLSPTDMYCCNGYKFETYRDGFPPEPTASVRLTKKFDSKGTESIERSVVSITPSKTLWRELPALLTPRSAFGIGGALAISNAPFHTAFDLHVCAMIRDQASMDIAIESVFHISPKFHANTAIYQAEVQHSERLARKLSWAIETYRKEIDGGWEGRIKGAGKDASKLKAKLHSIASIHFWTTVEKNLGLLMNYIGALGTNDAIPQQEKWRKMLFKSACEVFTLVCGQDTSRQRRAFAIGWQRLTSTEDQPVTNSTENKEDDQ